MLSAISRGQLSVSDKNTEMCVCMYETLGLSLCKGCFQSP